MMQNSPERGIRYIDYAKVGRQLGAVILTSLLVGGCGSVSGNSSSDTLRVSPCSEKDVTLTAGESRNVVVSYRNTSDVRFAITNADGDLYADGSRVKDETRIRTVTVEYEGANKEINNAVDVEIDADCEPTGSTTRNPHHGSGGGGVVYGQGGQGSDIRGGGPQGNVGK